MERQLTSDASFDSQSALRMGGALASPPRRGPSPPQVRQANERQPGHCVGNNLPHANDPLVMGASSLRMSIDSGRRRESSSTLRMGNSRSAAASLQGMLRRASAAKAKNAALDHPRRSTLGDACASTAPHRRLARKVAEPSNRAPRSHTTPKGRGWGRTSALKTVATSTTSH
jgi:hypothetical protein